MADFFAGPGSGIPPLIPGPEVPPPNYTQKAQAYFAEWIGNGWQAEMLAIIANGFVSSILTVIGWIAQLMDVLLAGLSNVMKQAQSAQSPEFYELTAAIISDLLGIEVDPTEMQRAAGDRGTLAAMERVGGVLFDTLTAEFTGAETGPSVAKSPFGENPVTGGSMANNLPHATGATAARRFLGFVMSFAVRAGNVSVLSEMSTLGVLKNFREYGEAMATNLGLGRMVRRALTPIVQTLVAAPLQTQLNLTYRPKDLTEAQVVRAFNRGYLNQDDFNGALARLGYPDSAMKIVMEEQLKIPATNEVEMLYQFDWIDKPLAKRYVQADGFTSGDADYVMKAWNFAKQVSWINKYIGEILLLAKEHFLDTATVNTLIDKLPLYEEEKKRILDIVGLYRDTHSKRLSATDINTAYLEGIIDVDRVHQWYADEGYNQADAQTLFYLLAFKQKDQVVKAAATGAAAAAKAKATEAKQAADAAAATALAGGSTGRPLTYIDWENAFIAARLTDEQFKAFLTEYGYVGTPLLLQFAAAKAKQLAEASKTAKAAKLLASGGTKELDLAQIEASYIAGVIQDDELTKRLNGLGYSANDVSILAEDLAIKRDAEEAKQALAGTTPAGTPKPKETLAQGVALYVGGLSTRSDLQTLLGELGYSQADQVQELELADAKRNAAEAKASAASTKKVIAVKPKVSLAEEVAGYVAGDLSKAELTQYLTDKAYTPDEVDLLLDEADKKLAAQALKNAAAGQGAGAPTIKPLTEAEESAAFIQGLVSQADFRTYLAELGYSAQNQDILISLSAAKKKAATAAATTTTTPVLQTGKRKLTVAEIEAAYLNGTFKLTDVTDYFNALGFGKRDIGVLEQALLIKANAQVAPPVTPTTPVTP